MVCELRGLGKSTLPDHWQVLPIRAMVKQVKTPVLVTPGREYPIIGVRWYGAGAYVKDVVTETTTEASHLYKLSSGQLVYNRLFAWKGSFALLGEEHEGAYASGEFPTFVAREGFDVRFVYFYLLQEGLWEWIAAESTGATANSRNRWQEVRLRSLVIPSPPHREQQAIADFLTREVDRIMNQLRLMGAPLTPEEGSLAHALLRERYAVVRAAVTGAYPLGDHP